MQNKKIIKFGNHTAKSIGILLLLPNKPKK